MQDWFSGLVPVVQAFIAGCFTWFVTALGAGVVFVKKDVSRKILDSSLGFAAGVMISASFWSLLLPAIEYAEESGQVSWLPATIGFLLGGVVLRIIDKITPHLHLFLSEEHAEGIKTDLSKTALLIIAITIHNFPEGLSVGVAFGAIGIAPSATVVGAIALAVGIGLQNFPEGMAVSMPLRREGFSRLKSFWYGQLSAIVEPVGAVLGAGLVSIAKPILPYALAFAAGAMIYVVIEEVIPESQSGEHSDLATVGAMIGFTLMMILDVALG